MNTTSLSFSEASAVVLHFAESFREELPAGGYADSELNSLARRLAYYLDGPITASYLDEIIVLLGDLDQVDHGIHPDLRVNRPGTVDNTADLLDYIDSQISMNLHLLITDAGVQHRTYTPAAAA